MSVAPCCFICEDDGGELLSVCSCTGRWMHLHCQRRLMAATPSHSRVCPVCTSAYSNVYLKTSYHLNRRVETWLGPLFPVAFLALLGTGSYELYFYIENGREAVYLGVSVALFGLAFLSGSAFLIFCLCRRSARQDLSSVVVRRVEAEVTASAAVRKSSILGSTGASTSADAITEMEPWRNQADGLDV